MMNAKNDVMLLLFLLLFSHCENNTFVSKPLHIHQFSYHNTEFYIEFYQLISILYVVIITSNDCSFCKHDTETIHMYFYVIFFFHRRP